MQRLQGLIPALLVCLAACGGVSSDSNEASRALTNPTNAAWKNGRLSVDVPVPVVTVGFPEADVAALRAALQPLTIDHDTGDLNQSLPPDPDEVVQGGDPAVLAPGAGETITLPVLPTAHYQVTAAPSALEQGLVALIQQTRTGDGFDANAAEDFLASVLPLNADAPTIVVLHLKALGVNTHTWKIQGQTGFIAPVRVFGERHPLLVLDPSAQADSYAAGTTTDPFARNSYHDPVASSNSAVIAEFVRDATQYRVLQGSVYPVPQAPCHAVTALLGVRRETSLSYQELRHVEDAFDEARVKAAWDHLTGTDVFFDFKILSLPADDPALDALARGEFGLFEVMRAYLSVMFEQYHVEHPGCDEYLTVVFAGDVATVPGGGVLGIGTYDDSPGHRIAMGWVHEIFRYTFDPESDYCISGCDNKDYLNWWEYLISHETGHILGQRHPHDISVHDPDPMQYVAGESNNAFSSVWSSMSYQQDGRMIDFGKVDRNNWLRNRAGFALLFASEAGREGSPAWNAAMERAAVLDWQGVWEALRAN